MRPKGGKAEKPGITLFAMTQKGLAVLRAVAESFPGAIDRVVTARDRAVQEDHYEAIVACCDEQGIPWRDRRPRETIETTHAVAVSWRWLLPVDSATVIVFHDSLLPRYRGFNPLVSALLNGDETIGVTALLASEGYDEGDILGQSASSVAYPITIQEAIDVISNDYAAVALEVVARIMSGRHLAGVPQEADQVSYSLWRDEEDYRIDWHRSAAAIRRFVDAVGPPYKGAFTTVNGEACRVLEVEERGDVAVEHRQPGKVIFVDQACPVVVCGTGLLRIKRLVDEETRGSRLPLKRFRSRFR